MPDRTGSDSDGNSAGATRDGVSDSNSSNLGSDGGWTGGRNSEGGFYSMDGWAGSPPTAPTPAAPAPSMPSQDIVQNAVDRYGNPVYTGDTARGIIGGTLSVNQFGQVISQDALRESQSKLEKDKNGIALTALGLPASPAFGIGDVPAGIADNFGRTYNDPSRTVVGAANPMGVDRMTAMTQGLEQTPVGPALSDSKVAQSFADPSRANMQGYSSTGISYNDLKSLTEAGYGKADISPSQTVEQAKGVIDTVAPTMDAAGRLAELGIRAAMPLPMSLVVNFANEYSKTKDFSSALGSALTGGIVNSAIGKVNQAAGQVIGPDAARALSAYNSAASVANAASGSNVAPTFSVGGYLANMLGLSGSSPTSSSMPDGQTPVSTGGWAATSGGGGGSSSQTYAPVYAAPAPAASTEVTNPISGIINNLLSSFRAGRGSLHK